MYLCCINTYTCLEAQHLLSFFPNFYADVFCVLEVIKVYSKMLLFENINQNLMFVSASIRFLKTDHYFDTDFRIINMIHLRSLHHSPFYLYFFFQIPNLHSSSSLNSASVFTSSSCTFSFEGVKVEMCTCAQDKTTVPALDEK